MAAFGCLCTEILKLLPEGSQVWHQSPSHKKLLQEGVTYVCIVVPTVLGRKVGVKVTVTSESLYKIKLKDVARNIASETKRHVEGLIMEEMNSLEGG